MYCEQGLNIHRGTKRRIPKRESEPRVVGSFVDPGWVLGFLHDVLYDVCRFRTLNLIDEANLEALATAAAL